MKPITTKDNASHVTDAMPTTTAAIVAIRPTAADAAKKTAAKLNRGETTREIAQNAADAAAMEAFVSALDACMFGNLTDAAAVSGKNARFGRFAIELKRGGNVLARVHVNASRTQFWLDRIMNVDNAADGGEFVYTPATDNDRANGKVHICRTYDGVHMYKANASGKPMPRKITLQAWFNNYAKVVTNAAIYSAIDNGVFTAARNVGYTCRLVKDHSES